MINKPITQKVVLAGVIFNKEAKTLILQRHSKENIYPNMWELPSGKRNFLEASSDTLIREIYEETGLRVKVIQPSSVFDYQIEKPIEIVDSTQINFIVTSNSSQIKLSKEHQNYAWIFEKELKDYKISKETKKAISAAFKLYSKIL